MLRVFFNGLFSNCRGCGVWGLGGFQFQPEFKGLGSGVVKTRHSPICIPAELVLGFNTALSEQTSCPDHGCAQAVSAGIHMVDVGSEHRCFLKGSGVRLCRGRNLNGKA